MNLRTPSLLALLTFSIVGCKGPNAPFEGRGDPFVPPQVTFATRDIRNSVVIGTPAVQRDDAGNLLHVTLPIRSDHERTYYIDYRITFVDRNGATLSQTGWMPKTLESNTPDSITVNSYDNRAADFQLAIRKAR